MNGVLHHYWDFLESKDHTNSKFTQNAEYTVRNDILDDVSDDLFLSTKHQKELRREVTHGNSPTAK